MKYLSCTLAFLISISISETYAQDYFSFSPIGQTFKLEKDLVLQLDIFFKEFTKDKFLNKKWLIEDDGFSHSVFEEIVNLEFNAIDSSAKLNREIINYYPIGKDKYMIKVATYVVTQDQVKYLSLLWTIVAHKNRYSYQFSTPLEYNTAHWKTKQVASVSYCYKESINLQRANSFAHKNKLFSNKFNQKEANLKFYMIDNYQEIMQLIGIDYDSSSAGQYKDGWGVIADQYIFSIMNNEDFSHDLFHFYSGKVHARKSRNWVSEEGLAYSWGNAYYTMGDSGEIAGQFELINVLKEYLNKHPEIDLYNLFKDHFWTDTSGIFNHLSTDYKVGRLLSSLICDAVEEKSGMPGINQLISCGNLPDRFTSFLETANILIGINAENFNTRIGQLLYSYSNE